MLKNILIGTFLFTFLGMSAQHASIKGIVKNETDAQAMPYVSVSLDGNTFKTTDINGEFNFNDVKIGGHKLTIAFLGYEKIEHAVAISSENETIILSDLKLKPSAILISEVVISSPSTNFSSRYEGSNIIISSKEIELTKPVGTEEVLKKVAGVNVSGDMGISNRLNVGIRGSYPRRSANLLLLEDGTPIAPAPYLAPEAYYNPPSDRLDGIEILKGADILAFGSNTMYGVINYITKKPPLKPTLGINLTAGENGYHSEYLTYGGTWNNIGAELQVLNKQFDGFQDNSQSSIFNTTAKLYSELTTRSSVYVKLNYHQEKSKASYSALTPYTYKVDPRQNPFDADDLYTKRYAADLIYNFKLSKNTLLSTKVYVSQFQRDWWRQENTLIKASTALSYLGQAIYDDRYSYLNAQTFGSDDYIRVGKIAFGEESTRSRNRLFRVGGAQQSFKYKIEKENFKMNLELIAKGHWETFNNVEIKNDSSRFSRSGTIDRDQYFTLNAYSGMLKDKISYKNISITPSLRYEWVEMRSFDRLAISKMTNNDGSKFFGSQKNVFSSFVPGVSVAYDAISKPENKLSVYAGVYRGYTAPTAEVGFLNVEDGIVSAPSDSKPINRVPETSLNYEAGLRACLLREFACLQVSYFNNNISNYYSAGRNEAFQTLGAVNTYGLEGTVNMNLHKLLNSEKHQIVLSLSGTWMKGKVLSGLLKDSDLLKAKHTDATKQELIDKINAERNGFDVYFSSSTGTDSLVSGELTVADFSKIKRLDFVFGNDGIANNTVPYLPPYILNAGLSYGIAGFNIGVNFNYVGKQYTDYLNFENETAEGAIGSLQAFKTIDANISYSFEHVSNKYLKGLTVFIAGKNITDEVYKASRLHRLSSGIMPGGFRQINGGVKFNF
ncbi:MAG: TonB-dependent receptor [Bacteroidia bacterium]|nr:TonB-dependent receptor [Bacteroidia bacterium]